MSNPNSETQIVQKKENITGDYTVTIRHKLVDHPWGEITWAIVKGVLISTIGVSAYYYAITGEKPNKLILGGTAIIGAAASLRVYRKRFTYRADEEVFHPDKK